MTLNAKKGLRGFGLDYSVLLMQASVTAQLSLEAMQNNFLDTVYRARLHSFVECFHYYLGLVVLPQSAALSTRISLL